MSPQSKNRADQNQEQEQQEPLQNPPVKQEPPQSDFSLSEPVGRFWQNPKIEQVLLYHDIQSSKAHIQMLGQTGILSSEETKQLLHGLEKIQDDLAKGKFALNAQDIDIHAGLERALREELGELASSVRIAKSRNDQIATDVRLWLRDAIAEIFSKIGSLRETFISFAERDLETVMPGYTHLQPACPILLSHWWLAHELRFRRDSDRLFDLYKRVNMLPLGAGALGGTNFPIDRNLVAQLLGFDEVMENSLDAVSDRDYLIEFAAFAALTGQHLSQIAEDLLLWQTQEFGFIKLRKAFSFKSLSMPQKRNPELIEILRARPAALSGRLAEFLIQLKALPMGFSQDLQECLPGLLDIVEKLKFLLELAIQLLPAIEIDATRMRQAASADLTASSLAVDFLVAKGLTQEQAARVVEQLILYCKERNKNLPDLAINEWQYFSPAFDVDIFQHVTVEESVSSRTSYGGTASMQVSQAIERAKESLDADMIQVSKIFSTSRFKDTVHKARAGQ
jgi:argininosuccinate lyase